MNEKEKANLHMVNYLFQLVENDRITDAYDRGFITRMRNLVHNGLELSDRQEAYLEKCFHEKY